MFILCFCVISVVFCELWGVGWLVVDGCGESDFCWFVGFYFDIFCLVMLDVKF